MLIFSGIRMVKVAKLDWPYRRSGLPSCDNQAPRQVATGRVLTIIESIVTIYDDKF